jgi:hypothetical protein
VEKNVTISGRPPRIEMSMMKDRDTKSRTLGKRAPNRPAFIGNMRLATGRSLE